MASEAVQERVTTERAGLMAAIKTQRLPKTLASTHSAQGWAKAKAKGQHCPCEGVGAGLRALATPRRHLDHCTLEYSILEHRAAGFGGGGDEVGLLHYDPSLEPHMPIA